MKTSRLQVNFFDQLEVSETFEERILIGSRRREEEEKVEQFRVMFVRFDQEHRTQSNYVEYEW